MVPSGLGAQPPQTKIRQIAVEILIGTHNKGKIKEIANLLSGLPVTLKTLDDFPEIGIVEEDGETLEENAIKKAHFYSKAAKMLTVADDTGLEVAALKGAPGVYSARYAGENCTYEDNNRKLIAELEKLKTDDRRARFRCVIALAEADKGYLQVVDGFILGEITQTLKGGQGFGYDPVFYVPEIKKTLAELTLEEKNKISHRAMALNKAKEILKDVVAA